MQYYNAIEVKERALFHPMPSLQPSEKRISIGIGGISP
jgi:hypothetical protein